jgi:hypothetical protein
MRAMREPAAPSKRQSRPGRGAFIALVLGALLLLLAFAIRLQPGDAAPPSAEQQSASTRTARTAEAWIIGDAWPTAPLPSLAPRAAVTGTIRSQGGAPLAFAQVCAFPETAQLRGRDDAPRCTRSDATGHYRIAELWPVRTRVRATAAEHQPGQWQIVDADGRVQSWVSLLDGRERDNVDITLEPGGVRLAGIVHDLVGGVVEDAQVCATHYEQPCMALAQTDEHGHFELWVAPGRVDVHASAEGYTRAKRPFSAPSEGVELFLLPEAAIVGRVVDAVTGAPVADAEVWAGPHRVFQFDRGPALQGPLVRSDDEGRFRIGGLEPGLYDPGAIHDGRHGQAPAQIPLGLGETSAPVEIHIHPSARVIGRVIVAETGQPCAEPDVALNGADGTRVARTDSEGNVELLALEPDRYEVWVHCPGYVAEPAYPAIELESSTATHEQTWQVHVGAAVRGVVVDSSGRALAGMDIRGFSLGGNPVRMLPPATAPSDAEGRFVIHGVAPERYELRASGPAGSSEALTVEVAGTDDVTGVRLVLAEGGSLRGRVIDEQGVAQAQLEVQIDRHDDQRSTSFAHTDDAGEFELLGLAPAPYRLSLANDPAEAVVTVELGEQAEVELRVAGRNGLIQGRVLDVDGAPVSDAFVGALAMVDESVRPLAAQRAAALARQNWSAIHDPALTDVDGRFTLRGLGPGEHIVHAHRRGGGTAVADSVALDSEVELRLSVMGSLAGTVALADGTHPDRFEVALTAVDQGFVRRNDFVRTAGAWSFTQLPAGRLQVQVEAAQGAASLELELGEGESRDQLEITLEPRITITGRIVDLDSGAPLPRMSVVVSAGLPGAFGSTRNGLSDAEGRFRVIAPSGEIQLFIHPEGGTMGSDYEALWTSHRVAERPATQDLGDIGLIAKRLHGHDAPGDLGFELSELAPGVAAGDRRATVAVVRLGSPAAAAGLAVGDVIEGVDGKSVRGRDLGRFDPLTSVPAGTELTLTLADGRTLSLVAAPR